MSRITLLNLAEELAARQNLSQTAAETFMHAFIATVENGLKTDGIVKIKGFGTFKLVQMSDRESINVNTGERIVIKGYNKVTFTPEASLKEFVNRPFAHFEPTELSDGYDEEETNKKVEEETAELTKLVMEKERVDAEQQVVATDSATADKKDVQPEADAQSSATAKEVSEPTVSTQSADEKDDEVHDTMPDDTVHPIQNIMLDPEEETVAVASVQSHEGDESTHTEVECNHEGIEPDHQGTEPCDEDLRTGDEAPATTNEGAGTTDDVMDTTTASALADACDSEEKSASDTSTTEVEKAVSDVPHTEPEPVASADVEQPVVETPVVDKLSDTAANGTDVCYEKAEDKDNDTAAMQAPVQEPADEHISAQTALETAVGGATVTESSPKPEKKGNKKNKKHRKSSAKKTEQEPVSVTSKKKSSDHGNRSIWWVLLAVIAVLGGYYMYQRYLLLELPMKDDLGESSKNQLVVNPNLEAEFGTPQPKHTLEGMKPDKQSATPVEIGQDLPTQEVQQKKTVVTPEKTVADATGDKQTDETPSEIIGGADGSTGIYVDDKVEPTPQQQPVKKTVEPATQPIEPAKQQEQPLVLTPKDKSKSILQISVKDTVSYIIDGTLAEHTLSNGETLIRLSLKYYGDKRLWPYIVKYNNIKDYDHIAIGTVIRIPNLKNKP